MDNAAEISIPLKRKLKSGNAYTKLLPKVNCTAVDLGDGSNDTIEGVEFMADWIKKYAWQTEKLTAKLLKEGKISRTDIPKTVAGIYNFLYNHEQYTADGKLQQLRSPACAWKQRKTGVDCKSYTIFAISILQNLGITAAIRQVKQPGFFPEQFTHVYVVVPENQSAKKQITGRYFVIDPTKHRNTEGIFLEAKDKIMSGLKYQGLNAAATAAVSQEAYKGFEAFLQKLLKAGVSRQKVSAIRSYVNELIGKGFDPFIATTSQGISIRPTQHSKGMFFRIVSENGLNGEKSGGGDSSWLSEIDWGQIISDIGSFFDFSCWGVSWGPQEGKDHANQVIQKAQNILGNNPISNKNFQAYENYMMHHIIAYGTIAPNDYSGCSKDTVIAMAQSLQAAHDSIMAKIRASYIVKVAERNHLATPLPGSTQEDINYLNDHRAQYRYTQHKITGRKPNTPDYTPPVNTGNNNNNNNGADWTTDYNPSNPNSNQAVRQQKSGSNTLLYGGLALGAVLLAWPKISKMTAPKPAAKSKNTAKK